MATARKRVSAALAVAAGLLFAGVGLFAFEVLSRDPLKAEPSTTHASSGRTGCLDCHAPIAEEWRQSYHYKSLTGPYWRDTRQLGYLRVFEVLRKPCVNCHAPANVLDLADAVASTAVGENPLGVECTPNLLRNPKGTIPSARSDDVDLGVDCTACHVSKRGIVGSGRHPTAEHEVIADRRFEAPASASETLCGTCHRSAVDAWKQTGLPAQGITCLECHMPEVRAASVVEGPERPRRSHRFPADKDPAMLRKAVNASLDVTPDRRARLRIRNDRVGHYLPSGGNWLSVRFEAYDGSGQRRAERVEGFGREEALVLDFWPFNTDTRIAFGEEKEAWFPLPEGDGTVVESVRYHDWIHVKQTLLALKMRY